MEPYLKISEDLKEITNMGQLMSVFGIDSNNDHILKDHVDVSRENVMTRMVNNGLINNGSVYQTDEYTGKQLMLSYIKRALMRNGDTIESWLSQSRPPRTSPEEVQANYSELKINISYKERTTGEDVIFNSEKMQFEFYKTKGLEVVLKRAKNLDELPFGIKVKTAYPKFIDESQPTFKMKAEDYFESHPEFTFAQKTAFLLKNIYKDKPDVYVNYNQYSNNTTINRFIGNDEVDIKGICKIEDNGKVSYALRYGKDSFDISGSENVKFLMEGKNPDFPKSCINEDMKNKIRVFKSETGCRMKNIDAIKYNSDFSGLNNQPKMSIEEAKKMFKEARPQNKSMSLTQKL